MREPNAALQRWSQALAGHGGAPRALQRDILRPKNGNEIRPPTVARALGVERQETDVRLDCRDTGLGGRNSFEQRRVDTERRGVCHALNLAVGSGYVVQPGSVRRGRLPWTPG